MTLMKAQRSTDATTKGGTFDIFCGECMVCGEKRGGRCLALRIMGEIGYTPSRCLDVDECERMDGGCSTCLKERQWQGAMCALDVGLVRL